MTSHVLESRLRRGFPWLWLALSGLWAVVIILTHQLAWPLALWIATTVWPLTYLRTSKHQTEPQGPGTKGSQE